MTQNLNAAQVKGASFSARDKVIPTAVPPKQGFWASLPSHPQLPLQLQGVESLKDRANPGNSVLDHEGNESDTNE